MQNNKNKIIICFGIIITIIIITIIGICYFVFNNKPVQQSKPKLKSKPKLEPNFEEPIIENQNPSKEQKIMQLEEKRFFAVQEWKSIHREEMELDQEFRNFHKKTHTTNGNVLEFYCQSPECVSWREKIKALNEKMREKDTQIYAIDQQITQLQDQDQQ